MSENKKLDADEKYSLFHGRHFQTQEELEDYNREFFKEKRKVVEAVKVIPTVLDDQNTDEINDSEE